MAANFEEEEACPLSLQHWYPFPGVDPGIRREREREGEREGGYHKATPPFNLIGGAWQCCLLVAT